MRRDNLNNWSNWPYKYIWQYKANPTHPFDLILEVLLHPLMVWKANGKITHWWHWKKYPLKLNFRGQLLEEFKDTFKAKRMKDHIKKSLGGWKQVYIVEPNLEKINIKRIKNGWHYAFKYQGSDYLQRCSIILYGPVRVLIGPGRATIYGLDKNNKEIPLKITGSLERSSKEHKWPII